MIKLRGSTAEGLITSHTLQIVHNTSRALDLEARLARLEERSRHAQINDESLCDSCHARLGTKLFAMYPDDTVVCYKVGNMPLLHPLELKSLYLHSRKYKITPSLFHVLVTK